LPRLVVAPEHFFTKPIPIDSTNSFYLGTNKWGDILPANDKQLTQSEKRHIVTELKAISQRHPNVLIFPGTINFKKDIDRSETPQEYAARHCAEKGADTYNNLINKSIAKEGRVNKAVVEANYHKQRYGLDIMKMHSALDETTKVVDDSMTHLVYNVAYAFADGDIIDKHKKVTGYYEVTQQDDGDKRVFIPGRLDKQPIEYKGVKHSLEICVDHQMGMESIKGNERNFGDVHIIESDFVQEKFTKKMMERAKTVVHSSTRTNDLKTGRLLTGVTNSNNEKRVPEQITRLVQVYSLSSFQIRSVHKITSVFGLSKKFGESFYIQLVRG
jgi:predicted amidohydrolase